MSSDNVTTGPWEQSDSSGGGGGMEARIARLEAYAESADRRLNKLEEKIDLVATRLENLNLRLAYAAGALFGGTLLVGWILSGRLDAIISAIRAAQ